MGRHAMCADCGADVAPTSAAPVVRGGAIALLCDRCGPQTGADADDYEDLVVETADETDYEDLEVSGAAADRGNAVHGTDSKSVSGALESSDSREDPQREAEPAVIVSRD